MNLILLVIPAKAGIQWRPCQFKPHSHWIPAFAGMTSKRVVLTRTAHDACPANNSPEIHPAQQSFPHQSPETGNTSRHTVTRGIHEASAWLDLLVLSFGLVLAFAAYAVGILVAGALFHHAVERPFLRLRSRWMRGRSAGEGQFAVEGAREALAVND